VIVKSIVSPLPESSDTKIDFTIAVVLAGHEYNVVASAVVKSTLEFL
jgi:hypothetical protein